MSSLSESIGKVNLQQYLEAKDAVTECQQIANSLRDFGAVLVKDPRVNSSDSDNFLDLLEKYFEQPYDIKIKDARPEFYYQVGVTPDGIERPRDNSPIAASLNAENKPVSNPSARETDPKWRFFWRCGERPESTDFPELNAEQVIPKAFANEWSSTMDNWGEKLLETTMTVSEMLSIGLDLPKNCLKEKLSYGPHLLAPTGSNMEILGDKVGTTIAGYHYDISFLTIHGRSRYPGLYVWTRTGKRIPVVVPEGYLLIQSGVELEYLTAGVIQRGMHEVVVSENTCKAAKKAKENGNSLWRVSSTLFAHVRSDASLQPLGKYLQLEGARRYLNVRAGEQVATELREIELAK